MRYFGFQNVRALSVRSSDGWHCIVEEHLEFRTHLGSRYRTKLFLRTDGGSIPRFLWWLLPPFGKDCWWSYILHDGAFQNLLEIYDEKIGHWRDCTLNEQESNALLYEAMESQKSSWWKYTVVWIALNLSGWRAFDEDRKKLSNSRFPRTEHAAFAI